MIPVGVVASARTVSASYAAAVLADAPLAYYRSADAAASAVMADSSGNGRNGAWGTQAATATSLLSTDSNAAATFNGNSNSAGSTPAAAWMAPLTAITLECWFRTSNAGAMALIGRTQAGAFGSALAGSYRVYLNAGQVIFQVFNSAYQPMFTITGGTGLANGVRHHVVATWDNATTAARLYADKVQIGTATPASATMAPLGTLPFYVGAMGTSAPLTGVLDEVAVYGTALSATRVGVHYDLGA